MSALIQMSGIEKRFPGVHALRNVQFDLRAGEVHALMGENGAGKSTLMKILSGVYQRDGGTILLEGQEASFTNPRMAQDAGIGIIHQELSLMNDLTIAQNIFIGREPRRWGFVIDDKEMERAAAKLFAQMKVSLDPAQLVQGLSIAKQQMVEIAKALSYDTRVLVMDEPTAALNAREIDELFRIIAGLRAAGKGIIYISHKMDEIRRISDRVTVMRDGQWIGTRDTADVTLDQIINMMVGRALMQGDLHIPDLDSAEIALEVRDLSRGREIRDVSFTLRRGEILGFAGLMGAGRTEVARAIFGADPVDSGEIRVNGKVVRMRSPVDAVRAGIGYLSEDRKHLGLALPMSVRDNIALTAFDKFRRLGMLLDETAMAQVARKSIAELDIRTPSDQQEVRLLSGGNQQKIVIAKWLLRDCEVLIFDEPTRGIDVGAKSEIYRLLNELATEGRAIIVISSELPEILRLCHRIAVMCEGRLTGFLPGGTTTQEQIMALATQSAPPSGARPQQEPA
ncbi:MAG: sugar ABC transporter ATP-binding protein [Natronohydrobacter sp.]|nr:sugar ABC transporter ATP-binding protein [Natronohydrobacter sp.]